MWELEGVAKNSARDPPILCMSQHSPGITLWCHRHFLHPTKQSKGTEDWATESTTPGPGWALVGNRPAWFQKL